MYQQLRNKLQTLGLSGAVLAATSVPAFAAIDVTDVTDAITDAAGAIGTVGLAVLVMFVGTKVFKWVRRAL